MSAAASALLIRVAKDKRVWKVIGGLLVLILLVATEVGTSMTGHNLQVYVTNKVAPDFAPLVASVNSDMEDGQEINTQLLYAAYITLFDNPRYPDKANIREQLIRAFYERKTKKVLVRDADGNPVLDGNGNKTYTVKEYTVPVTDTTKIFQNIESRFQISISASEREYMINLSQVLMDYSPSTVSQQVTAYEGLISQYCSQYGIPQYASLVMAVMQNESGGTGNDPMQCSESPLNTEYPQRHNGITDPKYSINIGIKYFESCLRAAKCKSPDDVQGISLALQGYNFGNGYINWALKKGGYTQANAVEFSQKQAARMGWDSYGDVNYVSHVLRYYSTAGNSGSGIFGYPIKAGKYTISSPFGYRSDPTTGKNTLHKGMDFAAAYGTPIYAGESGKVIFAEFGVTGGGYGGYGNVVAIQHSASTMSLYGHCSQLLVKKGEAVQKGQVIALVGSTGDSTGNHCHFEIRLNGKAVDPLNYLK